MCACLLWCDGTIEEKAEVLYQLVNPPDENSDKIKQNDKEWEYIIQYICLIATVITFDFLEINYR